MQCRSRNALSFVELMIVLVGCSSSESSPTSQNEAGHASTNAGTAGDDTSSEAGASFAALGGKAGVVSRGGRENAGNGGRGTAGGPAAGAAGELLAGGTAGRASAGGTAGKASAGGTAGRASAGGTAGTTSTAERGGRDQGGAESSGGNAGEPSPGGSAGTGTSAGGRAEGGAGGDSAAAGTAGNPSAGGQSSVGGMAGTNAGGDVSAGGTAGSAAGGRPPYCGDGFVADDEKCDTGLASGEPGACPFGCPREDLCVSRILSGDNCQAECVETAITSIEDEADMCCAGSGDVDCTTPYNFTVDRTQSGTKGNACDTSLMPPSMYEADIYQYVPLAPTCGVPVELTVYGESPGTATDWSVGSGFQVSFPRADTVTLRDYALDNVKRRARSVLVDMTPTDPAFATVNYVQWSCGWDGLTTTAYVHARPYAGYPLGLPANPQRVRIAGDRVAQFVVFDNAAATGSSTVELAAGVFSPYATKPNDDPSFALNAHVVLSDPAVDAKEPSIAVQSTAPVDTLSGDPYAHVVWVEGNGASLEYSRITSRGEVSRHQTIQSGTGIESPAITIFSESVVAITWAEEVEGISRIRVTYLTMATGTRGSIVDITAGEGTAVEPAIATAFDTSSWQGAIAWIDGRSGVQQLYYRPLLRGGTAGTTSLVSPDSVEPASPALQVSLDTVRIAWTDTRDGESAIYAKQSATAAALSSATDVRVSPAGDSAHHARLDQPTPILDSTGALTRDATFSLRPFYLTDTGVRFVEADLDNGEVPLLSGPDSLPVSCSVDTSSPDLAAMMDAERDLWSGDAEGGPRILASLRLAAWLEAGEIMVQAANLELVPQNVQP